MQVQTLVSPLTRSSRYVGAAIGHCTVLSRLNASRRRENVHRRIDLADVKPLAVTSNMLVGASDWIRVGMEQQCRRAKVVKATV